MNEHSGPCRSAIIVAIGRLEESLRRENVDWRELETLDAAGPLLATVERRMDLAEALAAEPQYRARAKLIEALICLDPPKVFEPAIMSPPEAVEAEPPAAVSPPPPPEERPAPAVPLAARITPLGSLAPADDLTRIRGIDAETAARLAAVGVQTFRDVSRWTARDVARVTAALDLGRRLHRENWIEQAAMLAMHHATKTAEAAPLAARASVEGVARAEPPTCETPKAAALTLPEPTVHFDEPVAANNNEPLEISAPFAAGSRIDVPHAPSPEPVAKTVSDAESTEAGQDVSSFDETIVECEKEADVAIVPAAPRASKPAPETREPGIERPDRAPDHAPDHAIEADAACVTSRVPEPVAARPVITPQSGLARLLAERAETRARRNIGQDEIALTGHDPGPDFDVPEADVMVVVRKGRPAERTAEDPVTRSPGAPDATTGNGTATKGMPEKEDRGIEASVEIVNPRQPASQTWRNAPPPPPSPEPPRPSRFFRALKGE